jgi:nitrite reductase/ring-hydroxylating ferredoxin subunit
MAPTPPERTDTCLGAAGAPWSTPPSVRPGEVLCRLDALMDPPFKAFTLKFEDGEEVGIFVVRWGGEAHAYVNQCPHQLMPLNWEDGTFLTSDGSRILCAVHGATFCVETGEALSGPVPPGDCLMKVPVSVVEGQVRLAPRK